MDGAPPAAAGRTRWARRLLLAVLVVFVLYGVAVAVLYANQRRMLFLATPDRVTPAEAGLNDFQEVVLHTPDGERLLAWWRPPPPGAGAVIYFHGNAGSLAQRKDRYRDVAGAGLGVLATTYRGYAGSTGSPSEAALIADAKLALDWLREQAPGAPVVAVGESLGSGVAVALAAERELAGVLLDSPYASIERTMAYHYPWVPVRYLARDRFDSEKRIRQVSEPVFIVHCDRDATIPIAEARRLYARAHEPKSFVRVRGCAHVTTWEDPPTRDRILAALLAFTRRPAAGSPAP